MTATALAKQQEHPSDLQRHVAVELGIPRSIHLPHAAFADLGGDGIRAEGRAGFEAHKVVVVRRRFKDSNLVEVRTPAVDSTESGPVPPRLDGPAQSS